MGREVTLFRVFGIPIKASPSWLFLVALIVFSLSQNYFPRELGARADRWLILGLSVVTAAGLFASLLAHEMCHSLVARATGVPVAGITLFIFGGVSQLEEEPPTALAEFGMAVVGPLSSAMIGGGFLVVWIAAGLLRAPAPLMALLKALAGVNFVLAAFNSLPAFPLDGGRVLRSVIWYLSSSLHVATRAATTVGGIFGLLFIVSGISLVVFTGRLDIGAVWMVVIGFFLRQAAQGSMQMEILRYGLEGSTVARFMITGAASVPPDITVAEFVDGYVFHHRCRRFPVVGEDGRLLGVVESLAPRRVPRQHWPVARVADIMRPAEACLVMAPETNAVDALKALRIDKSQWAVVVQDGRPVGILTIGDLLGFLALRSDLLGRKRRFR